MMKRKQMANEIWHIILYYFNTNVFILYYIVLSIYYDSVVQCSILYYIVLIFNYCISFSGH